MATLARNLDRYGIRGIRQMCQMKEIAVRHVRETFGIDRQQVPGCVLDGQANFKTLKTIWRYVREDLSYLF